MAAFDYTKSAATAARALVRFGAGCMVKRTTAGEYDPAAGGPGAPVTTATPSVAIVFPMPQKYIDGTLILQGDRQAYMAPAVEVRQGDVVTWCGRDLQVINVKPLEPAGVPVLYEAQLRG